MATESTESARDIYIELLFDKVREDQYPSGELLDRIEAALDPEHAQEYLQLLVSKIENTRYPSHQLLDRVEHLAQRMGG